MENKTLLIDKNAFCDWYFDHDICKDFFYTNNILEDLKSEGTFAISLEQILESVGYLPSDVVAEGQEIIYDEMGEVDMPAYRVIKFAPIVKTN